jgi:hypothetical protein
MHAAEVPRVAAVPAAEVTRRTFEDDDARACATGRDRGAQRGVPATDDDNVVMRNVVHAFRSG